MPLANSSEYRAMLDAARRGKYALPAINVSNISAINATLKGLSDAKSDGIIQISIGAGKFASGLDVSNASFGARTLASVIRDLAQKHDIFVAITTDHCQPENMKVFLMPLVALCIERIRRGLPPLFNGFMLDASALPLDKNLDLSLDFLKKCETLGIIPEFEIGVVEGEEDGAASEHNLKSKKLYSSPEDILRVREVLGKSRGRYLLAATFGNIHGAYKDGVVKLKPEILRKGQDATRKKFGANEELDLVFHGGSGTKLSEIQEALNYGVVKMNVNTDTQYAFTQPIAIHMFKNIDGVLKIDGEVGDKKTYDPRAYLKLAEKSMAERVTLIAQSLNSAGKSIANPHPPNYQN